MKLMNFLKNVIIIGFLVTLLIAISFGATNSLVTNASKPITNAITGSFKVSPSEELFTDETIQVTIERKKKEGAEQLISDCLNYYSEEYPEYKNITCNLIIKTNLLIDNSCQYIVGVLKEENGKNTISLNIDPEC